MTPGRAPESEAVDVAVVGGGHAGVEAAAAAARLGCRVLLITPDPDRIGHIACNPAIGGVGKGQLVREIDALGGLMARAADRAAVQYKTLNRARGPAVQSPRAQIDRLRYPREIRALLLADSRVRVLRDRVVSLHVDGAGTVAGVGLASGRRARARAVVVAAGTFLGARLREGADLWPGGRLGEAPSDELSAALARLGVPMRRLRTDTPPRIDARTVDFSRLALEPADERPVPFAHDAPEPTGPWLECYAVWTTDASRAAVSRAIARGLAPAVSGRLAGAPPRYCPNIESKFHDYPDTLRHHVFVEPESRDSSELYLNGLSTSIAAEYQLELVRSLPGFERARIALHGYAVEYDAARPGTFGSALEVRAAHGLFLAGQVCGTSGYEEAAGLGLLAGANAAFKALGRELWRPARDESYLGVLVDDLASREGDEPYRLFTSRAERRLSLRADNADLRLVPVAARLGLVEAGRARRVAELADAIAAARTALAARRGPDGQPLAQWLCRPGVAWSTISDMAPELAGAPARVAEQATIETRYAGYIERQAAERRRVQAASGVRIPEDFAYGKVAGLSREAREALSRRRPETLARAERLAGVGPAELALLAARLARKGL